MELIFEREDLWNAMQIVGNVAASRNTLPILANVLIKTVSSSEDGDQIQLAATDLEVGIKSVVNGQIIKPGSITVPAKKLSDIVRELPLRTISGEPVKVKLATLANDRVEIDCENAKFRIVGLTSEEFPPLPDIGSDFLALDSRDVSRMIQKTDFAVSTEETRHFLNGLYFCVTQQAEPLIKMVATDGRRLAVSLLSQSESVSFKEAGKKEFGVIIPTKAINNILRIFAGSESDTLKIALLENQIAFATQNITLISRLIEGEYPDWEAIISPTANNEIVMRANTEQLLSVVRRVSLLANPKTPSVKMESKGNELTVLASTPELGEAQEKMTANIEGGNIEIAFNARFVLDVLRIIEADEVLFKFRDSLSPVLVKPSDEDKALSYMCVIMPMRL